MLMKRARIWRIFLLTSWAASNATMMTWMIFELVFSQKGVVMLCKHVVYNTRVSNRQ